MNISVGIKSICAIAIASLSASSALAAPALTTLAAFNGTNGLFPFDLLADAAGNLYGVTGQGGSVADGFYGTAFEVAAGSHTISTLVEFNDNNGAAPVAGLLADAAGNLYGTTSYGGLLNNNNNEYGYGTVFEIAAASHTLNTLVAFNYTNGENPHSGLLADAAGNLYGTTFQDGPGNRGTVFEVAAGSRTLSTLAVFNGGNGDGPDAGLIADAAGNLYGTTHNGGDYGTIFEVAAGSHTLSTLATFNGANGDGPHGGLIADAAGNLYGTTEDGGSDNSGTIFELTAASHTITTLVGRHP